MSIEIKPKQFAGYVLIIFGLLIIGYVVFIANGLMTGAIEIEQITLEEMPSDFVRSGNWILYAVILKLGSLFVLVLASSVLLKYGIQLSLKAGD